LAETPFIASLNNGISPAPGTTLSNPFPSGLLSFLALLVSFYYNRR
jgi:hypothetical protein